MRTCSVWLGVVSVVSIIGLAAACAEPNLGEEPDPTSSGGPAARVPSGSSGTSGTSGASGSSGTSSSSGTSGTSGTPSDGGVDAADAADAAPQGAFLGAPAYVPTTGKSTFFGFEHQGGGNPARTACLDCHGPTGQAAAFFAGGTVFKSGGGMTPAAQVEIRLRLDNGSAISTYTDNSGNFFITASAAANAGVVFPLHAGARNANGVALAAGAISNGNCNNGACHGGGAGWIRVP
jgi:hypothetical protein